jgi:hypothetical protein
MLPAYEIGEMKDTQESDKANKRLLGCWASSGYSVQGCAQLEQKLRQCMDAPVCVQNVPR